MSYSASPGLPYQIAIGETVGWAYRTVIDNIPLLITAAWLPFLLIFVIELIGTLLGGGLLGGILAVLFRPIGFLVFGTVFTVRVHRFVLLGENPGGEFFPPGWSAFLIVSIKLGATLLVAGIAISLVAMLPPHILTAPLAVIGAISLGFLAARVSLVFPAAAIEQPMMFRTAWDRITGNYWRRLACALCCYVPVGIVEAIVRAVGGALPRVLGPVFDAVALAASFVGLAIVAVMLSEVYRGIVGSNPYRTTATATG